MPLFEITQDYVPTSLNPPGTPVWKIPSRSTCCSQLTAADYFPERCILKITCIVQTIVSMGNAVLLFVFHSRLVTRKSLNVSIHKETALVAGKDEKTGEEPGSFRMDKSSSVYAV